MMNYLLNLDQLKNPISGSIWARDQVLGKEFVLGHRLRVCILRVRRGDGIFGRHAPWILSVFHCVTTLKWRNLFVDVLIWALSDWAIQACLYIESHLVFFFPLSQVSCCEEEVYDWAKGAPAERAESLCSPEYYNPCHGGQVLPN